MRIIGSVVAIVVVLVAAFYAFGEYYFTTPRGTVDEAAAVVRAHFGEVRQIVSIVQKDRALGWVTPGLDAKDMTSENGPLTTRTQADYDAIAKLLAQGRFRDLAIMRDKNPPRELRFMRFVVFEPGWFGKPKPVMAEWIGPNESLQADNPKSCHAIQAGWYVCPFNP